MFGAPQGAILSPVVFTPLGVHLCYVLKTPLHTSVTETDILPLVE